MANLLMSKPAEPKSSTRLTMDGERPDPTVHLKSRNTHYAAVAAVVLARPRHPPLEPGYPHRRTQPGGRRTEIGYMGRLVIAANRSWGFER